MASSDSPPIVSPAGIIHVLGYTPTEGERGVPITVRIHFHPDLADAMYVRLVVGNKAVPTKVRQLPAVSYGRWQLYAAAPPFDRAHCASTKVLISVQALNEDNDILDSVTFGEFSYWAPGSHERRASTASATDPAAPTGSNKPPRLQIVDGPALRRRANTAASTAPVADRSPFASSPQQRKTRLHRRMKSQSLMRTKHAGAGSGGPDEVFAQTPVLELVTPLASICADWTAAESAAGRRLVRFTKIQDGRRLIVSCEPIPQDEFNEAEAVISCIYRAENDACYVTSVDVIYLLERLTNGEFPVEEKNRIRRNLEGLRPTTVSKHKSGYGDFFQRIMEFPDPKPRNIEKDLKVFDWNLLGQALEKILSKYSIYTTGSDTDDAPGPVAGGGGGTDTTPSSGSAGASSPELFALQLSYPAPDDTTTSRFLDQQLQNTAAADALGHHAIKFEPYAGDFSVLAANAGVAHSAGSGGSAADNVTDPAFASPVDSVLTAASSSSAASSCAPFPLFAGGELGGGAVGDAHSGEYSPWSGVGMPFGLGKNAADATGGMTQDNYNLLAAAYENNAAAAIAGGAAGVGGGGSQMHAFEGNPALDFDLYETYTFPGLMSDDALAAAGLGEHQYL